MPMSQREATEILRRRMDSYGLTHWSISFNNRKNGVGLCSNEKKTIYLSNYALSHAPNEVLLNTMNHEIAHALDFEKRGYSNHDYTWKRIAVRVGAAPSRFVIDSDFWKYIPKKYTYTCEGCGAKVDTSRRLKNMRKRNCRTCRGNFILQQNY